MNDDLSLITYVFINYINIILLVFELLIVSNLLLKIGLNDMKMLIL